MEALVANPESGRKKINEYKASLKMLLNKDVVWGRVQ